MNWWHGTKGFKKWRDGKRVSEEVRDANFLHCVGCPEFGAYRTTEEDFEKKVVRAAYGDTIGAGKAIAYCEICECPIGAEVDENHRGAVIFRVKGLPFVATGKVETQDEACPRKLWRNP